MGVGIILFVYYESINRELKTRPIYECRCDERLKTKDEESTSLGYTGLFGELEHLKIKMWLIDEMFVSVMGEYVPSMLRLTRKTAVLVRLLPIYECRCDERQKTRVRNLQDSHTLSSSGNWNT